MHYPLGTVKRNIVRADKAAVEKLAQFGVATVHEAMGRLGGGAPVTQVALDLGYDSVSAFSAMFRRAAGASPSAYRQQRIAA